MTAPEKWIVARGLWPLTYDGTGIPIPDHVLAERDLSLIAKGLFALLLANKGQPVNPYEDAYEDADDIAVAIEELIEAGLALRVAP